jgi:hydrogenase nickel incorporation protein HypB
MCDSCGCEPDSPSITIHAPDGSHSHLGHSHNSKQIQVQRDLLSKNDHLAGVNRAYFKDHQIKALNLVSSPGSGKTTLLTETIKRTNRPISVIEGDQQTTNDAERIKETGAKVVQVNTGAGCHLDAAMVQRAIQELQPEENSLCMIENVGNLVCPALFDLGEQAKVVIISVTEGDDKPEKYPAMFRAAKVCIINKMDLLPHVNFKVKTCMKLARQVNPELIFFEVSATNGAGMGKWIEWLETVSSSSCQVSR